MHPIIGALKRIRPKTVALATVTHLFTTPIAALNTQDAGTTSNQAAGTPLTIAIRHDVARPLPIAPQRRSFAWGKPGFVPHGHGDEAAVRWEWCVGLGTKSHAARPKALPPDVFVFLAD